MKRMERLSNLCSGSSALQSFYRNYALDKVPGRALCSPAMETALRVKGNQSSRMSGDEAEAKNEQRLWCPDCGEPVRLHRKGKPGKPAAHFEHLDHSRAEQAGCKLMHPYR